MTKQAAEFIKKQGDFNFSYTEFDELNFSHILKNNCLEIDKILPEGKIEFAIFMVKRIGGFIISKHEPPVDRPEYIKRYKKFYITSLDSFS